MTIMYTNAKNHSSNTPAGLSVGVLMTIVLLDMSMLFALYFGQYSAMAVLIVYAVCIAFFWLIVKFISGLPLVGFSPVILTKLLGNAIVPSRLGVAYLLVFVIHLGWLTDSTFNIISIGGQGLDIRCVVPLCCSVGGLACIVSFFPDPYKKKDDGAVKVIVSGMSLMGQYQWKKLTTALESNDITGVKETSIIPLIRMLVNYNEDEKCKLLILRSNQQTKAAFSPIKIAVKNNSTPIETLKREISIASAYSDPSETEDDRNNRMKLHEEYNVEFLTGGNTSDKEFEDFLKLLIKMFAHFEFPEKQELIKGMQIEFTDSCDYNKYSECFDTMAKAIQEYDDDAHEIAFNITPGTALVSSVMTLLAIDGDKKLYYHEQSSDKTTPSQAIQEVDKTKLPIENLLSQALEKISRRRA